MDDLMINKKLEKFVCPYPNFKFQLKCSNKEGTFWMGETSYVSLNIKDYRELPFEIQICDDDSLLEIGEVNILHKKAKDFRLYYAMRRVYDKLYIKEFVLFFTISKVEIGGDLVEMFHDQEVGCKSLNEPFNLDKYLYDTLEISVDFPKI